jgi:hypothetical protein
MQQTLVSKSEFAAIANISPGRVTQLISEGKIGPDAINGDGRSAKLILERAMAQFRDRRDVGQALGNGIHARTQLPVQAEPAPEAVASSKPAPIVLPVDPTAERIQRERLEQERIKTERMKREEAVAEGRYMPSQAAREEMGRVASSVIRIVEGGLADMATAISARFALPQRDVMHELQKAFREVRSRASAEHRAKAEAEAAVVEETA